MRGLVAHELGENRADTHEPVRTREKARELRLSVAGGVTDRSRVKQCAQRGRPVGAENEPGEHDGVLIVEGEL